MQWEIPCCNGIRLTTSCLRTAQRPCCHRLHQSRPRAGGGGRGSARRFLARRFTAAGLEVDVWEPRPGRPEHRRRRCPGHGRGGCPASCSWATSTSSARPRALHAEGPRRPSLRARHQRHEGRPRGCRRRRRAPGRRGARGRRQVAAARRPARGRLRRRGVAELRRRGPRRSLPPRRRHPARTHRPRRHCRARRLRLVRARKPRCRGGRRRAREGRRRHRPLGPAARRDRRARPRAHALRAPPTGAARCTPRRSRGGHELSDLPWRAVDSASSAA